MSQQHSPFVFGAGTGHGQDAPAFPSQNTTPSSNTATSLPPPPPAQQIAFQQNAQLPGIDMSALAGISPDQVALIARLLQSGALPLPPPPPGASAASVQPPPVPAPAQPAAEQSSNSTKLQQEDVDMDKEEGEVEEGEVDIATRASAGNALPKSIPKGPRNATSRHSSRSEARKRERQNGTSIVIPYKAKERQSQEFVLAMHQAGYSYLQLAEMVDNPQHLRSMFRLLGLPVSSDHRTAAGQPWLQAQSPPSSQTLGKVSTADISQKPAATKPTAPPKPAAKADRSAYLAKLQALKAGKGTPTATQPAAQVRQTSTSPVVRAPSTQQDAAPPVATPLPTSKAVKTELARQRLEAFKAERAAKLQSLANADASPSKPATESIPASTTAPPSKGASPVLSNEGLGAGLNGIAAILGQPAPSAEVLPPPFPHAGPAPSSRSFSGLPGLFMTGAQQSASTPVASQPTGAASQSITPTPPSMQNVNLPTKRLVTADSPEEPKQRKRPFGQSRSASEDESFIIENSDDEGGDTRMDFDQPSVATNALADLPRLPQGYTPGTPGSKTPNGITYEQHVKAIEALHRRIATMEARGKAQGKATVSKSNTTTAAPGLPGISSPSGPAPTLPPAPEDAPASVNLNKPDSRTGMTIKQQKEELSKRLAELENARRQNVLPSTLAPLQSGNNAVIGGSDNLSGDQTTMATTKSDSTPAKAADWSAAADAEKEISEGELEDESEFDFYGEDQPDAASTPMSAHEHVGSQATTASAVTEADVFPEEQTSVQPADAQQFGPTNGDTDMIDEIVGDLLPRGPITSAAEAVANVAAEAASEDSAAIGGEQSGSTHAQPTPSDSDMDIGSDAGDSDDSANDDGSGQNQPLEPTQFKAEDETVGLKEPGEADEDRDIYDPTAAVADVDQLESSDALSTGRSASESDSGSDESDDEVEYEPAPAGMHAGDTQTGDVQTGDSLVAQDEETPDDDLASELQPSTAEQIATEPIDQVRSTFDWLHGN